MKLQVLALACALALPAVSQAAAPKPLYRDPVTDGAADVSIVFDKAHREWVMFYTNRRATMKSPDPQDVAWVHATPIGMATSRDGLAWRYTGVAKIPAACTGQTLWAPELYAEGGVYHMWLTVVPGVSHRWGEPGATAKIVHLTSKDLKAWTCGETLDLGSDRVIDASVVKIGDRYRLWYKDERKGSRIVAVESPDLVHWKPAGDKPVADMAAEGPKVFRWKDAWWMVADAWKGLIVLRSDDAETWTLQPTRLLEQPGTQATDTAKGQHADVVVSGGRAFLYYFVHQSNEPQAKADPYYGQRTVIQVAELKEADGVLSVDREAPVEHGLVPPGR
ncbi:MAG TPA: glycoside hydrolase family 43 [Caulobacter sp.]|nr:glycoside hydrolase family 43 [Caulobacter sp.]